MYRNWSQLREGWAKNLALLFPQPERLALQSLFLWFVAWVTLGVAVSGAGSHHMLRMGFAAFWLLVYLRIRVAHFATENNLIAIAFGLPMFAYLLLRSRRAHAHGQVSWKGRAYSVGRPSGSPHAEMKAAVLIPEVENQKLRTGN
jgi:hypothetical protein